MRKSSPRPEMSHTRTVLSSEPVTRMRFEGLKAMLQIPAVCVPTSIRRTGSVVSATAGMIAPRKKIAVKPMKDQPLKEPRRRLNVRRERILEGFEESGVKVVGIGDHLEGGCGIPSGLAGRYH